VGTELVGSGHLEAAWRAVLTDVRRRFHESLIYAANHSGEEMRLTWWDAVDFIGVDAYYPLISRSNPALDELKRVQLLLSPLNYYIYLETLYQG
jgi:hypothetical protein